MAESCNRFSDATDFFEWAETVRDSIGFSLEALSECRSTICAAVWGTGNPDISGIGVVVAYVIEIIGALILAAALWVLHRFGYRMPRVRRELEKATMQGMSTFFDSAVFFCIAIQIASIVVLAKKDFIVSTSGFGVLQAQMTWAISAACILPLMYPISMVGAWTREPASTSDRSKEDTLASEIREKQKRKYALSLYCLVSGLFFYPVLSQLVNNWKPSEIGEGKAPDGKPDVMPEESEALFELCFHDTNTFSDGEYKVLAAFEAAASGVIILFSFWAFASASLAFQTRAERAEDTMFVKVVLGAKQSAGDLWDRIQPSWFRPAILEVVFLAFPMVLAGPLLWGIFRIRKAQQALAEATDNTYEDNEWTFGQVVAIVMFSPVIADMVYSWWNDVLK